MRHMRHFRALSCDESPARRAVAISAPAPVLDEPADSGIILRSPSVTTPPASPPRSIALHDSRWPHDALR
jgi:hypothetical protein